MTPPDTDPARFDDEIEAWKASARDSQCRGLQSLTGHAVYQIGGDQIDDAVALMRRALRYVPEDATPAPSRPMLLEMHAWLCGVNGGAPGSLAGLLRDEAPMSRLPCGS